MGLSKYSTDRFRDHDVHQSRILTVGLCGADAPVEEGPGFTGYPRALLCAAQWIKVRKS